MKVLFYDIEAFPHEAYVWGTHDQYIAPNQIKQTGRVACWAAKFLGEPKVHYADERKGHKEMVEKLHTLMSKATALCHYNGVSYDNKMMNAEFIKYGMGPPPPLPQIDLLKVVKKRFRFPSYKLEYVAKALGIGEKLKTGGFDLWKDCMDGKAAAWRLFSEYNKTDTLLLEELYAKLLPWIPNHPSYGATTGNAVCPNCGSHSLQSRGKCVTKTATYTRLCCNDCGAWSRTRSNEVDPKNILISI